MKALLNQLGFYLFFALLAVALLVWGVQASRNPDASAGEALFFFVAAAVAVVGTVLVYRYEKRNNIEQ